LRSITSCGRYPAGGASWDRNSFFGRERILELHVPLLTLERQIRRRDLSLDIPIHVSCRSRHLPRDGTRLR
jgi:hypothetical protein